MAQIASAIGRDFDFQLITGVSELPQEALHTGIRELEEAGLVLVRGELPDASCRFKHALIRDAAYSTLTRKRRAEHHSGIARALRDRASSSSQLPEPEVLAYHYGEAGDQTEAIRFWLLAAERARDRFANAELISHAREGLSLIDASPPGEERDRVELDFEFALGLALRAQKGFVSPEALDAFRRAAALSSATGDGDRQLECLRGIYNYYFVRGELREARPIAEEAVDVARRTNAAPHVWMASTLYGTHLMYTGRPAEGRPWYEKTLNNAPPEPLAQYSSQVLDPDTACRMNLAWSLWLLGFPDQATSMAGEAWQAASRTGNPFPMAVALVWICGIDCCTGRLVESQSKVHELLRLTRKHDIAIWGERGRFLEGRLDSLTGHSRAGLQTMRDALDNLRRLDARQAWTWLLAEAASECLRQEDSAGAAELLDEAFTQCEAHDERYWEADLHRLRGEVALARGASFSEIKSFYREAIHLGTEQGSRSLVLRAACSLAKLEKVNGHSESAAAVLEPVYGSFTEGFDTADLREAKSLLEEVA